MVSCTTLVKWHKAIQINRLLEFRQTAHTIGNAFQTGWCGLAVRMSRVLLRHREMDTLSNMELRVRNDHKPCHHIFNE